jgi:hypothetical protein
VLYGLAPLAEHLFFQCRARLAHFGELIAPGERPAGINDPLEEKYSLRFLSSGEISGSSSPLQVCRRMSRSFSGLLRVLMAWITSSRSIGLIPSATTTTQHPISDFKNGVAHGLPNSSWSSGCKLSLLTCMAAFV